MTITLSIEKIPDFETVTDTHERIHAICLFCDHCRNAFPEASLQWAKKAYKLAQDIEDVEGKARSLKHIAYHHWHLSKISLALEELNQSQELMRSINYYKEWGEISMLKGLIFWSQGQYEQAMETVYDSIRLLENKNLIKPQGWCYWALGVFNDDLKDYDKSLEYYHHSLQIFRTWLSYSAEAEGWALIGLGSVYRAKGNIQKASQYLTKAEYISNKYKQWIQTARVYLEKGHVLLSQQQLRQAEEAYSVSYQMRQEHQLKPAMVSSLLALAEVKVQQKQQNEAMNYLQEALQIAVETNLRPKLYKCHRKLSELYQAQENYKEAYHHIALFSEIYIEVVGEKTIGRLKNLESQFSSEKAQKENEKHRLKNVALKKAHDTLANKNKEMMDSMYYAQRIQQAILVPLKKIRKQLPDLFILLKPRDIVSGDFYWFKDTKDKVFIASVDCTGHGVPGAFMSMIGNELLHKIVNDFKITQANHILDSLNINVRKALKQDTTDNRDGMDMSLVGVHKQSKTMEFSGARCPLIYFQEGTLYEIRGNKMPIGGFKLRQNHEFNYHLIDITKPTIFYLFSDGYQDQFGGTQAKRFTYLKLMALLQEIHQLPMEEQKQQMIYALAEWQQNEKQIDDILVVGVQLS